MVFTRLAGGTLSFRAGRANGWVDCGITAAYAFNDGERTCVCVMTTWRGSAGKFFFSTKAFLELLAGVSVACHDEYRIVPGNGHAKV